MQASPVNINEQNAAAAFTKQAPVFDELYSPNTIIQYKRARVREHVLQLIKPGSTILELNAGTGEDAVFFASAGNTVHATDISEGMQEQLRAKVKAGNLDGKVSTEICSFTQLDQLKNKGPYDCIFSNFAGLNCTNELDKVMDSFNDLLKPGGVVTLVILPKFCLWETLLVFKGKFRTATRRFFSSKGRKATVEGTSFTCWYHSPRSIRNRLQKDFELAGLEGLCSIVPPSYIENFAEKRPALFSRLCKMEDKYKSSWPWKYCGDYFIISLRKNGSNSL